MTNISVSSPSRLILIILAVLIVLGALAAIQASRPARTGASTTAPTDSPALDRTPGVPGPYWPTEGWLTADASSHRVDAARLKAMVDYIKLKGLDINALVVIRDGYIVFETYGRGSGPDARGEVYSVTKSFASTLVGIAQRDGLLTDLQEKVLALLPGTYADVDERKQAMTLDDVLTMRTGLAWKEDDENLMAFYTAPNQVKYMLDLPMAAQPGTEWNYCSGCSQMLTTLVSDATGMKAQDFANRELFGPLGIKAAPWLQDRHGVAIGGWGLTLSAREMAKLGYLFLRGGTWDGQEIVSPEWVKAATTKYTGTDSDLGYGYHWWTHPKFPAYMALGRFGQTIYVNPQKDLVVAIRAQLPDHEAIFYLIETYIEPAAKN